MRAASLLVLAACSPFDAGGPLALDGIEPAMATSVEDVVVQLAGGFQLPITSSVDDGTTRVGELSATIGTTPLVGVRRIDGDTLEAIVPAGLALGTYDVSVQIDDEVATLPRGYQVISARVRPPAGPCGRPGALADDFADGTAAPWWAVHSPADVVESAGELVVTPSASSPFAGYWSDPYVDLTDAAAEVEVRGVAETGVTLFQLSDASSRLAFAVDGGMLRVAASAGPTLVSLPYDPVAHRIWRIEHAGSTVTFRVSPDGDVWTDIASATVPAASVRYLTLQAGVSGAAIGGTGGAPARFAELSTYVPASAWCPTQTLVDGFADATIGPAWAYHGRTSAGCSEYETQGSARVDQNGSQACDAFYASSSLYSLLGSELVTRITAIGTFAPGWITYVRIADLAGSALSLFFEQNMMCVEGSAVTKQCAPYSTAEDLWRIREASGTLYLEMGVTNGAYRVIHSLPTPAFVDAVRVRFGTLTDRAINTSIGLSVDRVNGM